MTARKINEVQVDRMILHVVAPKRRQLVLSERQITGTTKVRDFFAAHLQGGHADAHARAATIGRGKSAPLPAALGNAAAATSAESFVQHSRDIATALNETLKKDRRAADGTLALISYQAKPWGSKSKRKYLSLPKLDPIDGFVWMPKRDTSGKQYVDLAPAKDIMPSTHKQLQKAAFLRATTKGVAQDLLVLDRQIASPAQFFMKFLGATLSRDSKINTVQFLKAASKAMAEVEPKLGAGDIRRMHARVNGALAGSKIDVEQLIDDLGFKNETTQRFEERLLDGSFDPAFKVDRETADKKTSKRRFRGDNDLVVQVAAPFYDDMVDVTDLADGTREVKIITRTWSPDL